MPGPRAMHQTTAGEADRLREEILGLVRRYHAAAFPEQPFSGSVPVAGRVFDAEELVALTDSSLDFWLTAGRYADQFEKRFAKLFGLRHALLVNSGSSANLVALSALTSPELGERALRPGDEVITAACGFPTTVNPIVQNELVPVFVDVTLPTYNIDVDQLEAALSPRTRAVMVAHTLGNPFDLDAVMAFCKRHHLWLIEDCCDAVGSTYRDRPVGSFGHFATTSFYPAHHLTMGEGGAVLTNTGRFKVLAESFRDWGRACWCGPGEDDTCGKRFGHQLGTLPHGYDHKYTYTHRGYNLKVTDMQAAVGVAQLDKLDAFSAARRRNFATLHSELADLNDVLLLPEATEHSDPSWFGFPITVRPEAGVARRDVVQRLEADGVATRQLFAGNLTRQPAYSDVRYRAIGGLEASDEVMESSFWIGVYPGLGEDALAHAAEALRGALGRSSRAQRRAA